MSSSSSASYNSFSSIVRPTCGHGQFCSLKRSFTTTNPGRRYWRCPLVDQPGDCHTFVWYEEPFEGNAKLALLDCIQKFKRQVEREKKEKKEFEQQLEEIKEINYDLEEKNKKLVVENKSLKKSLKKTLESRRCRIDAIYVILFFMFLVLMIAKVVVKENFISSMLSLPR